jgi:hypothetical protein
MEPAMPGRVDQRAVANDMHLIILADHRGRWWAHPVVSTRFNTCISPISLHAAHEDRLGRLSMWRAFGGQNTPRVAFVFSIPKPRSPYLNQDRPHARSPRPLFQQIADLDRQRGAVLEDGAPDKAGEMIQQLATLRGIGVQSATVLVREAFVRDFANGKALGPYAGLSATPYSVVQLG